MRKRITIKDIAKLLGLSPSTVSRALSGHPDISIQTKSKVKEVAEMMNYTPDLHAKYLRTQHSEFIAVILPEINTFFTPALMDGINFIVEQQGFSLIIFQSGNSLEKEQEILQHCINLSVEGILLSLSSNSQNLAHLRSIQSTKIPLVLLDRILETQEFSTVSIDDKATTQLAINHLLEKGHRNIMGVFANPSLRMSQWRKTGFLQSFPSNHSANGQPLILEIEFLSQFGPIFESAMQQHPEVTAIFSMSDELMVKIHHKLLNMGLRIPEDIALISISDGDAPYYLHPNISHILHSGYQVGMTATELLFKKVRKENWQNESLAIETKLVHLAST